MTASLWIPGPLPDFNKMIGAAKGSGGRGLGYARLKKQWTETVWALAKQARLPRFPGRVRLAFTWVERDRKRDPDNLAAGGRKVILDGLVLAKVMGGDGWAHVAGWVDRFDLCYSGSPDPGVRVTLEKWDSLEAPPA